MHGAYIFFRVFSIILYILVAYQIYCVFDLIQLKRRIEKGKKPAYSINLARVIFGVNRLLKKLGIQEASRNKQFKFKRNLAKKIAGFIGIIFIILAIITTMIANQLEVLDNTMQAMAGILNVINDDESSNSDSDTSGDEIGDSSWAIDTSPIPSGGDGGASSSGGSSDRHYTAGSSKYLVKMPEDGEYCYWYHQPWIDPDCGCTWCGTWSNSYWGTPGYIKQIRLEGCALYSLSIAVSNLTNTEVTPLDILRASGVGVEQTEMYGVPVYYWRTGDKSKGRVINGVTYRGWVDGYNVSYDGIMKILEDAYKDFNFSYDCIYTFKSSYSMSDDEFYDYMDKVDEALDKGGYVWIFRGRLLGQTDSALNSHNHFVCIRKKIGDKYVIIDEVSATTTHMYSRDELKSLNIKQMWAMYADEYTGGDTMPDVTVENLKLSKTPWYTAVTTSNANKATSVEKLYTNTVNGKTYELNLYDGIPSEWYDSLNSKDVYLANTEVMLEDTYSLLKQITGIEYEGKYPTYGYWQYKNHMLFDYSACCNIQENNVSNNKPNFINTETGQRAGWDDNGQPQLAEVDGVQCAGVALAGGILNRNHSMDENGNKFPLKTNGSIAPWLKNSFGSDNIHTSSEIMSNVYKYGHKRLLIVLEKNGKKYYLPATTCDAKAATFPGDFSQTGVTIEEGVNSVKSGEYSDIVFPKLSTPLTSTGYTKFVAVEQRFKDIKFLYDSYEFSGDDGYSLCTPYNTSNKDKWEIKEEGTFKRDTNNAGYENLSMVGNIAEFWQVPKEAAEKIKKDGYVLVGVIVWGEGY